MYQSTRRKITTIGVAFITFLLIFSVIVESFAPPFPTRTTTTRSLWRRRRRRISSQYFATATINSKNISKDSSNNSMSQEKRKKQIIFIRHACTFMNEYLSRRNYGSPNFSDVFTTPQDLQNYQDTKLSPRGQQQAKALAQHFIQNGGTFFTNLQKKQQQQRGLFWNTANQVSLKQNQDEDDSISVSDIDLIVFSPLTRACQTLELGLMPALIASQKQQQDDNDNGTDIDLSSTENLPPIVALPAAAERVYLVSDIGTQRSIMAQQYPWIDFQSQFIIQKNDNKNSLEKNQEYKESWWFTPNDLENEYEEWRPTGQNQTYAYPGEPDEAFYSRMKELYRWLDDRPESIIVVIAHWGVLDCILGRDFDNCEYEIVPFSDLATPTTI